MPQASDPSRRTESRSRKGPVYDDAGIVLRSHKLGESDKILRIMTREHGKRSAVAKGVRKTMSRFGARLEPLTCARLLMHRGRNMDTIRQAEILISFAEVREDLELFVYGSAMAELIDCVTQEHGSQPELFDLLLTGLRLLSAEPARAAFTLSLFEIGVLAEAGYALHVSGCAACGGEIGTGEVSFSLKYGGLLCDPCRAGRADAGKLVRVGGPVAELVRWMSENPLDSECLSRPANPRAERELRMLMDRVLEHMMEKEFRSHRVMKVIPAGERGSGG